MTQMRQKNSIIGVCIKKYALQLHTVTNSFVSSKKTVKWPTHICASLLDTPPPPPPPPPADAPAPAAFGTLLDGNPLAPAKAPAATPA